MSLIVAPSILAADFAHLGKAIDIINQSKAEWIHIDVMDGHFVPNISFGLPVMEAIQRNTDKYLDVHLMINNPDDFIEVFAEKGADNITIHEECSIHLHRSVQKIKELGISAGVALNPHSALHNVEHILQDIDLLLLMSVNPGFGGQKFIPNTINKLKQARKMIAESNRDIRLQVDGGVTPKNAAEIYNAGADVLVAGSAFFKAENPLLVAEQILSVADSNNN